MPARRSAGCKLGIEAVFNREIRDKLTQLLAYQRDAPVWLRILTPWIGNAKLSDGKTLLEKLRQLINYKYARVTLIIDKEWMEEEADEEEKEFLRSLEDMGVRLYSAKQLHAKMTLVINGPNDREKSLIISSANLTDSGLSNLKEAGIYVLNDPAELFDKANSYFTDLLKYSEERDNE